MDKEKQEFNYKEFEADAIKRLQNGEALEGKDGILALLLKRLIEAGLNGELEGHLEESLPMVRVLTNHSQYSSLKSLIKSNSFTPNS
jgi:hypothetical protein